MAPPSRPSSRSARSGRWPGILLRTTVFGTVFLAAVWVSPTMMARYYGDNGRKDFRTHSRADGRVITKDGALSWAMVEKPVEAEVANPYVPGAPSGTSYTESSGAATFVVTVWDLPGKAPDLDAVLRQFEQRDRSPYRTSNEIHDEEWAGLAGRRLYGRFDFTLPTDRYLDVVALAVPASGRQPSRLVLLTSSRPETSQTINGLTPPEAQDAANREFQAILASVQRN